MAESRIEVDCRLSDCTHHRTDERGRIWCLHADKPAYLQVSPCPLYRLEWKERSKNAQDYLKIFSRR